MTVAALFVDPSGIYGAPPQAAPWFSDGKPQVVAWDLAADARGYSGPHPVVAHPPCQRWGRFWHGSTRRPHQFRLGEDGGCFAAALTAVRNYGGILEHCADSRAWPWFGLHTPSRDGGWVPADDWGGFTCYVEQGFYGHFSRKPTWLYACKTALPELRWGRGAQRLHPVALAKYGYEKARRIGMMAMIGGKDKTKIRDATPPEFAELLFSIASSAHNQNGDPCSK
jgi:hypothetical protein